MASLRLDFNSKSERREEGGRGRGREQEKKRGEERRGKGSALSLKTTPCHESRGRHGARARPRVELRQRECRGQAGLSERRPGCSRGSGGACTTERARSLTAIVTNERKKKDITPEPPPPPPSPYHCAQPVFIGCGGNGMVLCRSIKLPMARCRGDDDEAVRLEAVAATSHADVDAAAAAAVGVNLLGAGDLVQNRLNFV